MTIKPTNTTFRKETGQKLKNTSFLKLHKILKDFDENQLLINIFRSYVMKDHVFNNKRYYTLYEIGNDQWWDTISYNFYETDSLWWVIATTNDVINPFEELNEGDSLKILKPVYIYKLLKEVEQVGEL